MDRRKSLKLIATGAIAVPTVLAGCNSEEVKKPVAPVAKDELNIDRAPEEMEREKKLMAQTFFTDHEMKTIAVLSDIIIPADEISGSATDAKVPEFIEFIVKDMPQHQTPMRGGLRWLDIQSNKKFQKAFMDCSQQQQLELVDQIAYPDKANPQMKQGVSFFNLMRNLTATGFYTSPIGIKDIGYQGNKPNQWNGVPDDVLKQHGLSYTEKELQECVSFS
ncbi:MAG: gluconate 2-dehydrogenase subunit 3 family protein [Chitinophagaceae bacterium]